MTPPPPPPPAAGAPRPIDFQRFAEEKTEPPTLRRRQEARRRGQVVRTPELGGGLVLLAAALWLSVAGGALGEGVLLLTRELLGGELQPAGVTSGDWEGLARDLSGRVLGLLLPLLATVALAGLASQLVQVGFVWTLEPVSPRWERVNLVAGVRRIFSRRALVELAKAVAKVAAILGVTGGTLWGVAPRIPGLADLPPVAAVEQVGAWALRVALWAGVLLVAIGLLDYLYQRHEHEKSLRMSREEVREELRQAEGDPQVRQRVRRRQRELARSRMAARIPRADVVVTNPVHVAVALEYDETRMQAPVVVAKGAGWLARRIRELAREHGVPVVHNPELARALYRSVEVGQEIPVGLYRAVAEVLAYVYRLRGRAAPGTRGRGV